MMEVKQPLQAKTTLTADDRDNKPSAILAIWRRYFYYFVIMELVIIFGAGYWWLLKPKIQTVFSNQAKINLQDKTKQAEITKLDAAINELTQIKNSYLNLSAADADRIKQMLPNQSEERDLMSQINKIVAANGMLLKKISLEDGRTDAVARAGRGITSDASAKGGEEDIANAKSEAVAISLEMGGVSYPALKSLLAGLESNLRLIDVDAIKYSPQDESAILVVKAYYQPDSLAQAIDLSKENMEGELNFLTNNKWKNLRSNAEAIEIQTKGNRNPF